MILIDHLDYTPPLPPLEPLRQLEKLRMPLPFVVKHWPLEPSALGKVNVSGLVDEETMDVLLEPLPRVIPPVP